VFLGRPDRATTHPVRGVPPAAGQCPLGCDPTAAGAHEEAVITTITPESWAYAENFTPEDATTAQARRRGREVGAVPIGSGGGCALRVLAAAIDARTVVEVGTGAGVSGLYLLAGMRPDGVLTSIDIESEHLRLAREAFTEAGIGHNRTRLITGAAMDVLPRLTDEAYDLVFCDADKAEYSDYLQQAVRLLRPGGVVAFDNALWHDRVADPAQRDPDTVAIRELGRTVRDDDRLIPALLPVGDGLLVAVKREPVAHGDSGFGSVGAGRGVAGR
jgi:predicted O-methyltransferase YrrM